MVAFFEFWDEIPRIDNNNIPNNNGMLGQFKIV